MKKQSVPHTIMGLVIGILPACAAIFATNVTVTHTVAHGSYETQAPAYWEYALIPEPHIPEAD